MVGLAVGWGGGAVHALEHVGVLPVPDHVSLGVLGHPTGDRAVRRPRLRGRLRPGRDAGPARPDRRPGQPRCHHRGRQAVAVVLPGPVGDLRSPPRAWGLGLGAVLGSAGAALFAIGVWLLTVVIAYASERAGVRGPAEVLLRRLVYRRSDTRSASTA